MKYTDLITVEHSDKPKFCAMVNFLTGILGDIQNLYHEMPNYYDIDIAVGAQLDVVGQWVGLSRKLDAPIDNVYFSFDTTNLGFDNGVWMGPFDPLTGIVELPDDYYRLALKAKIINNHWDGSKSGAYDVIQAIFEPFGILFFIQDNADLSMDIGILTPESQNALIIGMLKQGKFNVKPAGIRINYYISNSSPGTIFAFDLNNAFFGGFDSSSWATLVNAETGVVSTADTIVLMSGNLSQTNEISTGAITI